MPETTFRMVELKVTEEPKNSLPEWIASVRDKYCPPTSYSAESRSSLCVILVHSDPSLVSQFVQISSLFRVVYCFPSTTATLPLENAHILKNDQPDQPCFLRWFEESYLKQTPAALIFLEPFPSREIAVGPAEGAVPTNSTMTAESAESTASATSESKTSAVTVESTSTVSTESTANAMPTITIPQTRSDLNVDNLMRCGCQDGRHSKLTLADVLRKLLLSNLTARCPMLVLKLPKDIAYERLLPETTVVVNTDISPTHIFVAFVCHPLQRLVPSCVGDVSAASRRQFQFLVSNKTNKEHLYQRLQQLLSQKLRNMPTCAKEIGSFVDSLVFRERVVDDEEIYNRLRLFWYGTMVKRPEYLRHQEDPVAYHKWRTTERLGEIQKMLPPGFQPTNILDVGCSEGSITAALGKGFRLTPSAIFGCDVRDLPGMEQGFTFTVYDGTVLPYADNSIHLAVALMSLHHVDDVTTTLLEIKRVLQPGGYFAIREHDMDDPDLAPLIDVFHGMYARVWSDPAEMPEFCSHYKATYRSRLEWAKAFHDCGFVQTATSPDRQPLKAFTGGRWIKNPFRFYWGCWQKPLN